MFKKEFKYYKSRSAQPQYDNVIDCHLWTNRLSQKVIKRQPNNGSERNYCLKYGLIEVTDWKIYEFNDKPGLICIVNPFTQRGQQYWVQKCLQEYTKKPSRLNLDPFNELLPGEVWWDTALTDKERGQRLLKKLRWATLGYHHNWDTKEYSEDARSKFPSELAELSRLVVEALEGPAVTSYSAEAAIINFYHLDSSLSGHKDVSEPNMSSPLLSISFGQSAIFLVGGETQDDPVTALFLHSGDILIMSGEARHFYHGVPRIIFTNDKPWAEDGWECTDCGRYLETSRININVRQVLPPGQNSINR